MTQTEMTQTGAAQTQSQTRTQPQTRTLRLVLNGVLQSAPKVPPEASLLTALRDHFGLWGSKNACEQGECGSCTVYLDGDPVCSCLVAAGQAAGRQVRTIEGLAEDATGSPGLGAVQRAFLACGAVQCGFCTPGLVVAVDDLLRRTDEPGPDTVREALAGNLCRCTGYEKILEAVAVAAAELRAGRKKDAS
jgi:carbon-monoxide dehydrogenase small subunit